MPSCNQTISGLAKDCSTSKGGIIEVAIANYDDVASVTATSGKITAITMVTSKKFKRFYFPKNTGSLTSTYNIDRSAGTTYVQSDLVLQFNRMETTKRVEVAALAVNEVMILVKDANNIWWLLGKDEAVVMSAGDGQTGTARADGNRYQITLTDTSDELPMEIDSSVGIESLID